MTRYEKRSHITSLRLKAYNEVVLAEGHRFTDRVSRAWNRFVRSSAREWWALEGRTAWSRKKWSLGPQTDADVHD